ncbi:MAG: efflux transporter periplasmic adaptor subunit [Xanthobacteraceae bacterium]|jgi:multidrug efflux system membrane fusion protein|nr:efflux transporter periplasmic adaptor subunit [Xanthobacteraceae bacterium]
MGRATRGVSRLPTGRSTIAAGALLALGLCLISTGPHAQNAPPPAISVAKPLITDVVEVDDFIGRFEAVDQIDIRARVSGYVDRIHFTDGAMVKAGDLLFTIDQRPYQTALDEAQATLESARARLDFATADFERAKNLRPTGYIALQNFDERAQTLATAKADVSRAMSTLSRMNLDLQFTEIRAPISGRMSRRYVSIGNLVTANDTILSNIVSVDPIYFNFDVDERSYLEYQKVTGAALSVSRKDRLNEVLVATSDETEPTHKGRIDFTDNRLDNASGTLRARAVLDNKDLSLKPGQFGRIHILASDTYKGVLVPEEALGTDQDSRVVFIVGPDNVVGQRKVRVGPRREGYRIIREGLKGDELIVVNGLAKVRPGTKIDPKLTTLPAVAAAPN